jgi:hypothetical protein
MRSGSASQGSRERRGVVRLGGGRAWGLQACMGERGRMAREGRERKGMAGGARQRLTAPGGLLAARQKQEVAMVLARDSRAAAP